MIKINGGLFGKLLKRRKKDWDLRKELMRELKLWKGNCMCLEEAMGNIFLMISEILILRKKCGNKLLLKLIQEYLFFYK